MDANAQVDTLLQTDRVMTSGSLGGEMVIIPAQNARGVGSISALGAIFPMFVVTPTTLLSLRISVAKVAMSTCWCSS